MQFDQLKRCEFIMLLGSVVAWPVAAGAQQPLKIARIGYLSAASVPDVNVESFKEGMRSLGYVEGRDFVVEIRYAQRDYSRFPALVEELLRAKADLIVTGGPATQAAPLAGRSVPVVFGFSGNPVNLGIVASFARPGGNATGSRFSRSTLRPNALKCSRRSRLLLRASRCCRIPSMQANHPSCE
jgi:putative tryptophan/tyrosine transport system substrate-binding protein